MSAIDKEQFPRGALIAAAALIALSLAAAGYGRFVATDAPAEGVALEPAATALALSFVDEADGAVSVRDHATGALVTTLAPGEDAFVRSVLRSFVRARRARGIDSTPPFRLSQWANGTLILEDPSTGKRIDLRAFGPTNKEAFARIVEAGKSHG